VRTIAEILVIDDNPPMRRLVARILTEAAHTVHVAAGGRAGIALFHQVHPALVITDIVMPDTEGIETIKELRRAAPTLRILAISGAYNRSTYLHAATVLGATAALDKPFGSAELVRLVENLLNGPTE
jgi:DNA-binding response OmpR family regulator